MGLSHYLMSLLIYKNGPCRFMKKITTRSAALTLPLNITQTLGCLGYNHTDMLILLVFLLVCRVATFLLCRKVLAHVKL